MALPRALFSDPITINHTETRTIIAKRSEPSGRKSNIFVGKGGGGRVGFYMVSHKKVRLAFFTPKAFFGVLNRGLLV